MAVSSIEKAVDLLEYSDQGPDMQNMRAWMREETLTPRNVRQQRLISLGAVKGGLCEILV